MAYEMLSIIPLTASWGASLSTLQDFVTPGGREIKGKDREAVLRHLKPGTPPYFRNG
jgi:hypothetical protein